MRANALMILPKAFGYSFPVLRFGTEKVYPNIAVLRPSFNPNKSDR